MLKRFILWATLLALFISLPLSQLEAAKRTIDRQSSVTLTSAGAAATDSITSDQIYNDDGVLYFWFTVTNVSGSMGVMEVTWRVASMTDYSRCDPVYIDSGRVQGAPYSYISSRNIVSTGGWWLPTTAKIYRAVLFDPSSPSPFTNIPEGDRVVIRVIQESCTGVNTFTRRFMYEQEN